MNTSCQKKKNDYRFLMRRVGVHRLLTEGRIIKMALVEIDHGAVVHWNTFTDEQPFTEWLGGTMEVVTDSKGVSRALWKGSYIK